MNEGAVRSALIKMSVGDRRQKTWFTAQGLSEKDLSDVVERDYLVYYEKDLTDFMSDDEYVLTQAGRDFAWSK